ncbi:PBSX family phage terminase large subunit [Dactylosporangium sp. CS-033363]|uniref:PBSX family phage terminase large subunit n=1 Tax=Dactylosporangium sp. CS-033363 TaxID=3239935 RepID=UPI003D90E8CD
MGLDLDRVCKTLSPIQIRSIVHSTRRINIWTGAIRSGKTVASLLRWLIFLASDECPKGRIVMVGQTRDTVARNVFSVLQDPEIFGAIADEVHYTPGAATAKILGRTIDIIGAADIRAERRLRGLTAAAAYVDEATLLGQEFWTQLLGRMSKRGAKLFATTNPDAPGHWLRKDFLLRAGELDLAFWHFTLDDNPSLTREYKDSIKAEFVGLWFRRWILGHWVAAEGAIFDMFDERRHVIPDEKIPPISRWLCAGIDYGTTNPFVGLLLGLGNDNKLYVTSEYSYDARQAHRSKSDADYLADVHTWLQNAPHPGTYPLPGAAGGDVDARRGVHPEYIVIDPSAASFVTSVMSDSPYTPMPARNAVLPGIRAVATLLGRRKLKIARSCKRLIEELPGYSWDDEAALLGEDKPIKTDDHACDALRYAVLTTESLWRQHIRIELPKAKAGRT